MEHSHSDKHTHTHTHVRIRSIAKNKRKSTKFRVSRPTHDETVEKVPNSIQFAYDCSGDNNSSSESWQQRCEAR